MARMGRESIEPTLLQCLCSALRMRSAANQEILITIAVRGLPGYRRPNLLRDIADRYITLHCPSAIYLTHCQDITTKKDENKGKRLAATLAARQATDKQNSVSS